MPRPTMREVIVRCYGNMRIFRQRKRAQARSVLTMLKKLGIDSQAMPDTARRDIRDATILIERVVKDLSQRSWGK